MEKLSERDICTKYITPNLISAGWDLHDQIREEVTFTNGKVIVDGKSHRRGEKKRADYILYYKPGIPIAIIEVKRKEFSSKDGIQQALNYSEILDIPFVFSSNGEEFYFHDKTSKDKIEHTLNLKNFPSPKDLWEKYRKFKNITYEENKIVEQDYYSDSQSPEPRYYQQIAINKTVESIAKKTDNKRHLLVMATGTGKTYTAFQIIYRLWKSGKKKRILFLADRNALIDQTVRGDFRHFKEAMTTIKNKKIDKAYNVYLALYQGLSDNQNNDAFKQFSPNFFDLVVVDECHRGSARDDSKWREILEYFKDADHLGMTATPKETRSVSNIEYFGEPLYTYSLKQGIDDGFLAPYKVVKVTLDVDAEGWRPPKGFKDKSGNLVEDRIYNILDFDKNIVIEERRELVAKKITEYLKSIGQFSKTILFCTDIEHAAGMREKLVNANVEEIKKNSNYVMQITGDNDEGKKKLDDFIDPSEKYPVIATTSKLLTTGVDAQTCKLIVLDSNIGSMTEFKQIIGRGTRINEDFEKYYFTILDFRNVTSLFADKEFDGEPIKQIEYSEDQLIGDYENDFNSREIVSDNMIDDDIKEKRKKITVSGVEVVLINERVQYLDINGKLITKSLKDYTKSCITEKFKSLDNFLNHWNKSDQKKTIINELENNGVMFKPLQEMIGKNYDPFDLICHVAYEKKPLTRQERITNVKKTDYFTKFGDKAKKVLDCLMEKYSDLGIIEIEDARVITIAPINKLGTPHEIMMYFGGKEKFNLALKDLKKNLYKQI